MRPAPLRRSAPQLALPPRPPHRCVWPNRESLAREQMKFRMPAEWEPHEATWLAWPHEKSDWPGKFAPIPWLYGEIVRHLARVERVRILVEDEPAERAAKNILKSVHADLAAVDFFHHR